MTDDIRRLNAGCGRDIRQGFINVDTADLPGVDLVHDLNQLPLPFDDNIFDEILCNDVLEHLEYIPVLKDLHRILKPGGKIFIRVPHFTSRDNFADPTHKKRFSIKTFDFFVTASKFEREYYFDFAFEEILNLSLGFRKGPLFYNHILQTVINSHIKLLNFYEMTGLCYIFPASDLSITLRK